MFRSADQRLWGAFIVSPIEISIAARGRARPQARGSASGDEL
jgi:hypothetical protein